MLTNTDMTLYHREYNPSTRFDEWRRTYLPTGWWYENEQSAVTSEGLQVADAFIIRIPDTSVVIKKDDYLVYGNCRKKIQTVKDLEGTEHCKVTSANYNRFGDMPHIKVGGV